MPHVQELLNLNGRVAIVTGGSRGLGLEMAEGLAEAGAKVVIAARREQWLGPATDLLRSRELTVIGHTCDITDPRQCDALTDFALHQFGRLDILVNNAGVSWGAPFEDMSLERWKQVLDTNVIGTALMTKAALQPMKRQNYGKIINMASVMGLIGIPAEVIQAAGYTASKGAIVALTRELAVNYARFGILVNAIAPGFFPTRMTDGVIGRAGAKICALTPLGRLGHDDDLKGVVVFLAAAASDYITGQVITVDGGLSVT